MAKVPKNCNPNNVQIGQKWKARDPRRERKFTITDFQKIGKVYFAKVDYGDLEKVISLERFGRYERCK